MNNVQASMSAEMGEAPDPRYVNERYLLDVIKKQLGITDEDMRSISMVRSKVRDAKIDVVLEN
jgi:hypothetical protein